MRHEEATNNNYFVSMNCPFRFVELKSYTYVHSINAAFELAVVSLNSRLGQEIEAAAQKEHTRATLKPSG